MAEDLILVQDLFDDLLRTVEIDGDQQVVFVGVAELGSTIRGTPFVRELDIGGVILCPLLRGAALVIDDFNWVDGFADATVETPDGMNEKRPLAFIDAVDRAFFNADFVLDVYTGLADYIGHNCTSPVCSVGAIFC